MNANARNIIAGSRDKRLSVDKLPMLAKLADDIAELTMDAFRTRLSSPATMRRIDMRADKEEVLTTGEGVYSLPAILSDPEWDCPIGIILCADFIYTLAEVMLGSDGQEKEFSQERAFSTIERGLSKCFIDAAILGLNRGIAPFISSQLAFDKFDTRLEFLRLAAREEDAIGIRYELEALQRRGNILLVLPARALKRFGAQLSEPPVSAARKPDPQWARDFEMRVTGAGVAVEAFADVAGLRLSDVADFRPGKKITLPQQALQTVVLRAEGRSLFHCELGQSDGFYSVRVRADYDAESHERDAVHAISA